MIALPHKVRTSPARLKLNYDCLRFAGAAPSRCHAWGGNLKPRPFTVRPDGQDHLSTEAAGGWKSIFESRRRRKLVRHKQYHIPGDAQQIQMSHDTGFGSTFAKPVSIAAVNPTDHHIKDCCRSRQAKLHAQHCCHVFAVLQNTM
jgi:hypothetical protein